MKQKGQLSETRQQGHLWNPPKVYCYFHCYFYYNYYTLSTTILLGIISSGAHMTPLLFEREDPPEVSTKVWGFSLNFELVGISIKFWVCLNIFTQQFNHFFFVAPNFDRHANATSLLAWKNVEQRRFKSLSSVWGTVLTFFCTHNRTDQTIYLF